MTIGRVAIVVLWVALVGSPADAQPAGSSSDPRFRVDWELDPPGRRGTTVTGYVYNNGLEMVRQVQLRIEAVDAAGAVVAERYHWVVGDIAAGGRAFFTGLAPTGPTSYRVSIASFQRLGSAGQ